MPVPLFISYAHEDQKWLDLLSRHLASLETDGLIEVWDDRDIRAGSRDGWEPQLRPKLEGAKVIVILLSPDFAASNYCQNVELPLAISRKTSGQAIVYFVLARRYSVEKRIRDFQVLPSLDKALKEMRDKDAARSAIAEQIRKDLENPVTTFTPAQPQSAPKPLRAVPPFLPFLVNRTDQESQLRTICDEPPVRAARPVVFVVSGPKAERHDALHERLAREFLPSLLACRSTGSAGPMPILWPHSEKNPQAVVQAFVNGMAGYLSLGFASPASICQALPEGLTLFTTTIDGNLWNSRQQDSLKALLTYWNAWPDVPAGRSVCIGVSIECGEKAPNQRALQKAFPVTSFPDLRFRILPELAPVQEQHARVWLKTPKVRQWYDPDQHEESLIGAIQTAFAAKPAMPMNEAAPILINALRGCA